MPALLARGRIFIPLVFARLLAGAAKCATCLPGRPLYSPVSRDLIMYSSRMSERLYNLI
jgi:hypothetical protein